MPDEPTPPEETQPPALESAPGTEGGGGEEKPTAPEPTSEEVPAWAQQIQSDLKSLQKSVQYESDDEEEEFDPSQADLGTLIERYVDGRVAPLEPYVQSAAEEAGRRKQEEYFAAAEKKLGKFDHGLAHRVADSIYRSGEVGDDAEKALEAGVKFAAEYRKAERDDAVKEFEDGLKKPLDLDPGAESSGLFADEPAKDYDDVISKWAAQSEV